MDAERDVLAAEVTAAKTGGGSRLDLLLPQGSEVDRLIAGTDYYELGSSKQLVASGVAVETRCPFAAGYPRFKRAT